jgi:hypothetical protein
MAEPADRDDASVLRRLEDEALFRLFLRVLNEFERREVLYEFRCGSCGVPV